MPQIHGVALDRSALAIRAAVATALVALAVNATEVDGQQLVPRPADAPRIYSCFDGPVEGLQMALEADRRPMRDETAFVVTRATFSNTGELVVIDGTAGEVMTVGPDLEVLARFGEQGEGPGEFGRAIDAGIDSGGRVWILDDEPPSLVLFDSAGEFVKEIPLPARADRLAIGGDAIYVSTRIMNVGPQRDQPILWRYDLSSEKVEPILSFSPSWVGRPPVYRNVMTQTIPRVGLDGHLYLGFVESNEIWRVRDDGSHEVVVRGCLPEELRDAYTARDPQGRRTGILISDFTVLADGRVLVRGGLLAEGGGRPWEIYSSDGELIKSWSLGPSGLLSLYVTIHPLKPSTHLTWDRATGSAKLVAVSR